MGPQRSEPVEFAAGDTLWFYRFLPEFQNSAGWSLAYEVYTTAGAYVTNFSASPWNEGFEVSAPGFMADADPTVAYRLAGYVSNSTQSPGTTQTPLRHQVYSGNLRLTPNLVLQQTVDKCDFEPYERQQVKRLRATLLLLNQSYLEETDIQRVRVLREKREAMRTELCFWEERLHHWHNNQKVRNGLPDPTLIRPAFNFSF